MSNLIVIACLPKGRNERVRVSLDRYRGRDLVDIRVTAALTESSGIQTPTKKGVSLAISMLPSLIEALREALQEAQIRGLA